MIIELHKYLEDTLNMEAEAFYYNELIKKEQDKCAAIKKEYDKAVAEQKVKFEMEPYPERVGSLFKEIITLFFSACLWLTIPVVIGSLIIALIIWSISIHKIAYYHCFKVTLIVCLILVIIISISGGFFTVNTYKIKYNETEEKNKEIEKKEKIAIQKAITKAKTIKQQEINTINNMSELSTQLQNLNSLLYQYYDLNILHERYRNLPAVAKLYEYFDTGICDSLTGANGAYSRFESENKINLILQKLDVIISKLNMLNQTNYVLYQSVLRMQSNINSLEKNFECQSAIIREVESSIGYHLGKLEDNMTAQQQFSKITAENTARINRLTEYQNFALRQDRLESGHLY